MLSRAILFLLALCLAYPAWGGHGGGGEKKPEPGTSVEMPFLVAPMSKDGDLLGYAYISSKLVCSSPSACITIREKLAFIQDGFVREVNAKPVSLASDPKEVDRDQLNVRLTAVAKRIVGADKVRNMTFLEIKFTALHPADSYPVPPEAAKGAADGAATDGKKPADGAKPASSEGATSKPAAPSSH